MVDLSAVWTVLETEAAGAPPTELRTVPTGTVVPAGEVEAGVDAALHRHLIVPLMPGEAVAEDRHGAVVQLVRLKIDGTAVVSLVCRSRALNEIFARLATEVLREVTEARSPARRTAEVLIAWRELLATGGELLGDERLSGLLGELLCLERIVPHDPLRRVETWSGPSRHQHDLTYGTHAVEVKSTTAREGLIVQISSVDQLDATPASSLHLAVLRMQPVEGAAASGDTLPAVIDRLLGLGVNGTTLYHLLGACGYAAADEQHYRDRAFVVSEWRVYDVTAPAFPRIVRTSFTHGDVPPGTLRLSYAVDLTNRPPFPLDAQAVEDLWRTVAADGT